MSNLSLPPNLMQYARDQAQAISDAPRPESTNAISARMQDAMLIAVRQVVGSDEIREQVRQKLAGIRADFAGLHEQLGPDPWPEGSPGYEFDHIARGLMVAVDGMLTFLDSFFDDERVLVTMEQDQ